MRQSIAGGLRHASCSVSRSTAALTSGRCQVASTSYHRMAVVESRLPRFSVPIAHFSTSSPHMQADLWQSEHSTNGKTTAANSLPPTLTKPPGRRKSSAPHGQQNKQGIPAGKRAGQAALSKGMDTQSSGKARQAKERDHWLGKTSSVAKSRAEGATQSKHSASRIEATSPTKEVGQVEPAAPKKTIAERIRGLWANIKYLFRFYYNGTKQIWKDRQTVREMRAQIEQRKADGKGDMRWMEKAIIELHDSDVRKLPLFLAILIILEEILPLVVIYAPSLLPSTCILPSQSLKMRGEEERKRGLAIQRLAGNTDVRTAVEGLANNVCISEQIMDKGDDAATSAADFSSLGPGVIRDIATVFGLRTWGSSSMIRARIDKHLRFLREDDRFLSQTWQAKGVESEEGAGDWKKICQSDWLWRASGRRGLRVSATDQASMERNLEAYVQLSSSKALAEPASGEADGVAIFRRAIVPLALYDGTSRHLHRLQSDAQEETSKGLRQRTQEVVKDVVEEEKRKEAKKA